MRWDVVAAVALGACGDPADPDPAVSCEIASALEQSAPQPDLDLVIVASESQRMATYHDQLVETLRQVGALLEGTSSLHVTMAIGGGSGLRDCLGDATFASDVDQPWWSCDDDPSVCRIRNFDAGALADVLACAAEASPANTSTSTALLQRAANAVAEDESGFARPDATLGVVVISADDDASPQPPIVYAERLRGTRSRPELVWVSTVTTASAERLAGFRALFPERASAVSIDAPDWTEAVSQAFFKTDLGIACLDSVPVDLDPDAVGLQADCVATDGDDVIPRCPMIDVRVPEPVDTPCYWIDPDYFSSGCAAPFIERARWDWFAQPQIRCACEVE